MGNASTEECDNVPVGSGIIKAIDRYCGCCAHWHSVQSSLPWVEKGPPYRGALYRHYKGGLYTVLGYSCWPLPLDKTDPFAALNEVSKWFHAQSPSCRPHKGGFDPLVVYLCARTGKTWIRDLSEWHEEVEVGGMKMPRFQHFSGGEQ